jgi:hypothetical protein
MPRTQAVKEDPMREDRILFDIVVDAYNETERALGWYYYLEQQITFPFAARFNSTLTNLNPNSRARSPLRKEDRVSVIGLAEEDDCMSDVLVVVEFKGAEFIAPLAQLECNALDYESAQAVSDWHYWYARGYQY